jgi:hypothetical protein
MAEPHRRRAIAYIAGRIITGSAAGSVFDYDEGRHVMFSGDVSKENVNVYDYDAACFITGPPTSLFHYGDSQHIQLGGESGQFRGFDYASGAHFSGTVSGTSVALFDYEDGAHHNYSI